MKTFVFSKFIDSPDTYENCCNTSFLVIGDTSQGSREAVCLDIGGEGQIRSCRGVSRSPREALRGAPEAPRVLRRKVLFPRKCAESPAGAEELTGEGEIASAGEY